MQTTQWKKLSRSPEEDWNKNLSDISSKHVHMIVWQVSMKLSFNLRFGLRLAAFEISKNGSLLQPIFHPSIVLSCCFIKRLSRKFVDSISWRRCLCFRCSFQSSFWLQALQLIDGILRRQSPAGMEYATWHRFSDNTRDLVLVKRKRMCMRRKGNRVPGGERKSWKLFRLVVPTGWCWCTSFTSSISWNQFH